MWILVAAAGYLVILGSLSFGCYVCRVPEAGLKRVAAAAVLPSILSAVASLLIVISMDSIILSIPPVLLGALFLAVLLGAPWFLRPADGGWGRAWGAAAVGGGSVCVLILLLTLTAIRLSEALEADQAAHVLYVNKLPYPASAKALRHYVTPEHTISLARGGGIDAYGSCVLDERWPSNENLSFQFSEQPASALAEIAGNLERNGYKVTRGGSQAKPLEAWVAGTRPGVLVIYRLEPAGARTSCRIEIWRDFARQKEAVCAALLCAASISANELRPHPQAGK